MISFLNTLDEYGEVDFQLAKSEKKRQEKIKKQIMDEFERQKKVAEYYQYAYNRCHEYPDGFEQLDMLWHAVNSGQDLKDSKWFKRIEEVKKNHPKPEGDPPPEYEPED